MSDPTAHDAPEGDKLNTMAHARVRQDIRCGSRVRQRRRGSRHLIQISTAFCKVQLVRGGLAEAIDHGHRAVPDRAVPDRAVPDRAGDRT